MRIHDCLQDHRTILAVEKIEGMTLVTALEPPGTGTGLKLCVCLSFHSHSNVFLLHNKLNQRKVSEPSRVHYNDITEVVLDKLRRNSTLTVNLEGCCLLRQQVFKLFRYSVSTENLMS